MNSDVLLLCALVCRVDRSVELVDRSSSGDDTKLQSVEVNGCVSQYCCQAWRVWWMGDQSMVQAASNRCTTVWWRVCGWSN